MASGYNAANASQRSSLLLVTIEFNSVSYWFISIFTWTECMRRSLFARRRNLEQKKLQCVVGLIVARWRRPAILLFYIVARYPCPLLTCVNKKLKLSIKYESYFLQINIIIFQLLL